MDLGIIIQARMGSSRLPGKILMNFSGNVSILDFILAKLHMVPNAKVIVATTDNQNNDELEKFLLKKNENVYRGAEFDVLERFICAAEFFNISGVIRICSDNPFLDVDSLIKLSKVAKENKFVDYIGFRVNGKPSILSHFGFWGEFVSLSALKKVRNLTSDSVSHEHVTHYIYNHPDLFKCKWIDCPLFLENRNDIRLTIDTIEDLNIARFINEKLGEKKANYSLKDIVNFIDEDVELKKYMMKNIVANQK